MKNANCPKRSARLAILSPLLLAGTLVSCVQVKTEPIRIEPIYIEITINHRVQKELDDLTKVFGFLAWGAVAIIAIAGIVVAGLLAAVSLARLTAHYVVDQMETKEQE